MQHFDFYFGVPSTTSMTSEWESIGNFLWDYWYQVQGSKFEPGSKVIKPHRDNDAFYGKG